MTINLMTINHLQNHNCLQDVENSGPTLVVAHPPRNSPRRTLELVSAAFWNVLRLEILLARSLDQGLGGK